MVVKKLLDHDGSIKEIDKEGALRIIDASTEEFHEIQEFCKKLTQKNFDKNISLLYPGADFPSISITGSKCEMNCQHCNHHYLETMIAADTPQKLIKICKNLDKGGANGCLISGGFDKEAKLPLEKFLNALREIKTKTSLILNLHTGLITKKLAEKLGEIGIDIVSFDITGDNYILNNVYKIDKSIEDYKKSLNWLLQSKIKKIVPHICIGLNPDNKLSEYLSLSIIKGIEPELIVLIAFIPTKNTPMESTPPPNSNDISRIVCLTRLMFPRSEISLGCMRPKKGRSKIEIEKKAFDSGITRMVLPSRKTINYITSNQYKVVKYNCCCGVSLENLGKLSI
ncbi:MAG: radical SAM protein [Promethearchaeota archaeon]|nr:MAG: radical SAM protein [Candidatus Lokiarchaeota archaeon]